MKILKALGFEKENSIVIPSHRSDIDQANDLAEEITRVIGYNNIVPKPLMLPVNVKSMEHSFLKSHVEIFL